MVPAEAVLEDGDNTIVFVFDGDTVERRAVGVEGEGNELEVLAGLQDGERVVISGHDTLVDGDSVRIAQ